MKNYTTDKIRNVAIVGHGGDGKTILTEAMLFNAKVTDRFGKVEDGTTTTDFDPEEIKRQISISAAFAPMEWNGHKINVIDVPGYFDFVGEMQMALKAADSAVIVLSAVSGLSVGAEKAWEACVEQKIPRMIFVNQMDRENANFMKTLDQLKEKYGTAIAPFQVPIVEKEHFKGFVNAVDMTARGFEGGKVKEIPIPDDMQNTVAPIRTMLVEAAAETSEELMEKYFDGEELTDKEIQDALKKGIMEGDIVPVLCGSALSNAGVQVLMDEIVEVTPSPAERPAHKGTNPKNGDAVEKPVDAGKPFSAFVFKTVVDPFVGKLSIFKVITGELKPGISLYNANKEANEKTGTLYMLIGKKQQQVDVITAGDIGAIAKLQHTETGDTLCTASDPVIYEGIEFPVPMLSMAVYADKEGDEDKVFGGLTRLEEEDPTFRVEQNSEIGQAIISGMGEMHLDVLGSKLKDKFKVAARFEEPRIAYRETIRKPLKAEGKHKKQTGGHGQYGHVWIEFSPLADAEQRFEFVDKIVGGVVPRQYIPAVEKGLTEIMDKGVLTDYPMTGLQATLYDGSFHNVDSSEMAFKVAASLAYKKLVDASPVLLEPIMLAEIIVPDDYMGDIIGDMNRRRGRIMGMTPIGNGKQKVEVEVPQGEVAKYATDLRSMTQARGSYTLTFLRYEEVPANLAPKIIEEAKHRMEEE